MPNPHCIELLEPRRLLAGTLVITQGGTYAGEWESNDPNVPAVRIQTTAPVIIENSTVRGRGDLIAAAVPHSNVTIRNTTGIGLNPNVLGRAPGRFYTADGFDNARIEKNLIQNTRGIHLAEYVGNFTAAQTVKVLNNAVRNVDGRKSNGASGWLDYNVRTRKSDLLVESGFVPAQFIQLDKVRKLAGIEIAGNEIINEPGNSRAEDVISIYKSSGTAASPISIHDNFIQGGYTIKPWQGNTSDATYTYDWGYSGGGILMGDGAEATVDGNAAYGKAYNNTVLDTTNYGIAIAGGHDFNIDDNRTFSAGVLSDGRAIFAQNVGFYVWDTFALGAPYFAGNSAHRNVSGWVNQRLTGKRNDWWLPGATNPTGDIAFVGDITLSRYTIERTNWQKAHAAPGPRGILAGDIFKDPNADGIRAASDAAAVGVNLYLDLNNDGIFSTGEPTTKSSSSGRYTFTELLPGKYVVRLRETAGWRPSKGSAAVLQVQASKIATRYFGMTTIPLVTGMIYLDKDADGGRDPGEGGLSGWTVYADLNRNGALDTGEFTTSTNKLGRYALSIALPGNYQVRVVQKPGFRITAPGSGHRPVSLGVGQIIDGRNFGQTA